MKRPGRWIASRNYEVTQYTGGQADPPPVDRPRIERRARRLATLAQRDPLTGLYHRGFFEAQCSEHRQLYDRRGDLAVLLIDVDGLGQVNAAHGWARGDALLRGVADVLTRDLGVAGVACRMDEDEFLVIRPMQDKTSAIIWAHGLCDQIRRTGFGAGPEAVRGTVSIGLAYSPARAFGPPVIEQARRGLRAAQLRGDRSCPWELGAFLELIEPCAQTPGTDAETHWRGVLKQLRPLCGPAQWQHLDAHGRDVGRLGARIAEQLDLGFDERACIRLAGYCHDLGVLLVPEDLLAKPTALSTAEQRLLARHDEDGAEMVSMLGFDERVADLVRHHHTAYASIQSDDRLGPFEQLGACILAVSDALSKMVTPRTYSPRRSYSAAIRELQRCSGRQFDPRVVQAVPAALLAEAPWSRPATVATEEACP